MQLSRFTDYSIRVLIYSAMNPERLVTLAELSQFYEISLDHLRKVVHKLAKLEYLQTFRGKNGGMKLFRAPQDINIGKLICELEGNGPLLDCSGMSCKILPECSLPGLLKNAQEAFYQELEQYTLADIMLGQSQGGDLVSPAK